MDICVRLKLIRENLNESQAKFAKRFDMAQNTYGQYELGKRQIPDDFKMKLAQLGINLHWFITGEGSMYLDGNMAATENTPICTVSKADTYLSAKGVPLTQEIPDGGLSVPVLAQKLSAGPGQDWTQEDMVTGERLPIVSRFIKPFPMNRIFAAEVRGDSMTGVQLFDGDMVFFVRGEINGDGIYVLAVDSDVYVKRVSFNPFTKQITIKSENERYEPMTVAQDRVTLLGKVIGWLHHHPY